MIGPVPLCDDLVDPSVQGSPGLRPVSEINTVAAPGVTRIQKRWRAFQQVFSLTSKPLLACRAPAYLARYNEEQNLQSVEERILGTRLLNHQIDCGKKPAQAQLRQTFPAQCWD